MDGELIQAFPLRILDIAQLRQPDFLSIPSALVRFKPWSILTVRALVTERVPERWHYLDQAAVRFSPPKMHRQGG